MLITPSPPLGAERVGVRWGDSRAVADTHLTLPTAARRVPSLSALQGGEGIVAAPPDAGQIARTVIEGMPESNPGSVMLPGAASTETEIRQWCLAYLARTVEESSIAIGPDIPFPQMGLDSATSAYFIVELEEWLGVELEPELVFDYPTVGDLARHIAARQAAANNRGADDGAP